MDDKEKSYSLRMADALDMLRDALLAMPADHPDTRVWTNTISAVADMLYPETRAVASYARH